MKYFSMFSGIGGFENGIKKAYNKSRTIKQISRRPNLQYRRDMSNSIKSRGEQQQRKCSCIGFSEIDKYAIQIYKRHFPEHKNYGDATRVIPEELPDFDLLCGGFPCQSFSIAGKRKGFEDTRGTLFFEICRIARVKRPSYLFLENVRGLLSHDNGYTFLVILESLAELGYSLQWQVLNSKDFGVPQNRERVFIIGHLAEASPPKVFPIKEDDEQYNKMVREKSQITGTINEGYWRSGTRQDGMGKTLIKVDILGHRKGYRRNMQVFNPTGITEALDSGQGGGRGQYTIAPTIRAEHHNIADVHFVPENSGIRRLTPTECERLQGFPDGWTEKGIDENGNEVEISDTQRYKCLGNAVTVNVIEAIMTRWLNHSFSENV